MTSTIPLGISKIFCDHNLPIQNGVAESNKDINAGSCLYESLLPL